MVKIYIYQGDFADNKKYKMPDGFKNKIVKIPIGEGKFKELQAEKVFHAVMIQIQSIYRDLVSSGISIQDAASILPDAVNK